MKTRMRFCSLMLSLCLLCSLLFCSGVNASALTDTVVTDGTGWVNVEKVSGLSVYGSDTTGEGSVQSFLNISLPSTINVDFEPKLKRFWIETDLSVPDEDLDGVQRFFRVPYGSNVSLRFFFYMSYWYQATYDSPLTQNQIEVYARVRFHDENNTIKVIPITNFINASVYDDWKAGDMAVVWDWKNESGYDCDLLNLTFGLPEGDGYVPVDVWRVTWSCYSIKYRIITDEGIMIDALGQEIERQTQEIVDRIDSAADQITSTVTDAVSEQTEEHRNMFQRLGDRISGFFDDLRNSIGGFFTQLGDRISGFFDNLLTGILDGLKSLFIPDSSYFTEYFDQWDQWMTEHFGALYYPIDLILGILDALWNLEVPENPSITFPAIQIGDTVLLEAQQYTFLGDDTLPALKTLYESYRVIVIAIFVFALANLAWRKLNSIMGGGQ